MLRTIITFMLLGLVPLGVSLAAEEPDTVPYTYELVEIPIPEHPDHFLDFAGITDDGTLLGIARGFGQLGFRIAPDRTLTPVLCPDTEDFTRYPFASTDGPTVTGINNRGYVVANDEGVDGTHALIQSPTGVCTFFRFPGSAYTWATGINDKRQVVGYYINPVGTPGEPGILRTHGFLRDSDGTFVELTGPGPNDRVYPTAINVQGVIIGYLLSDIQVPAHTGIYHGFVRSPDGQYTLVDFGDEDVALLALNNRGLVAGIVGQVGTEGGQAFLYDTTAGTFHLLPLPAPEADFVTATGINRQGVLVGHWVERIDRGTFFDLITHHFVATPAVKENGTVVVTNGVRVLGQ